MRIYFTATVDSAQNETLPISWDPRLGTFNGKSREFAVTVKNTGDKDMSIQRAGDHYDNLSIDIKNHVLRPGDDTEIKFKWNGEFQKENYSRSSSFIASGNGETRFSIPWMAEGYDPTPEPVKQPKTPAKKPVQKPGQSSNVKKPAVKTTGQ